MMSIPFSVGKTLENAILRLRRLTAVKGCSLVGLVWLAAVIAVMIVDSRIVIFDDRIRLAMSAGTVLLALVVSVFALALPLRKKLDFGKIAARIDATHPEFEECFSTLVGLSSSDPRERGFSASLFALVGDRAEGNLAKIDFKTDFPAKTALRFLSVFAGVFLALALAIAVSPQFVGRLFVRAVAPWADIGNLFSSDITVKPGDVVALSGTVIRIETASAKGEELYLRLSRRTAHGWTEETVEPLADGVYQTTADPNEREWRYRVNAGPAVTRYYHVRVSLMPKYESFTAKVTYPDYTGLSPLVVSNSEVGAIKAIAGSRVDFDLKVSDPDTLADFRIGGEPGFTYEMVSNKVAEWSLDLVNRDGFRADKGRHPLTSFIDQSPTVVFEKPKGTLRLPPHAKIPLEITANDDIAVTSLYLRVSIDNDPWAEHYGTRIDYKPGAFVRATADLDLSLYDLYFSRNVRFDAVVWDACPPEFGGPHSATSTPFTVEFNANESSWALQELRHEVEDAKRDLDEARKRLDDAKREARNVSDALRREEKVSEGTEKRSETLAHELSEAEKRLEELRDQFLSDERFAPLARPLERLLDETVKPLVEAVENSQFREKDERSDAVAEAMPEMEKARAEIEDFKKRLEERATEVDQFEKARDLADRQAALARAAKEILKERPVDTAKLEAWKRLEEAAAAKAEEFARKSPDSEFGEAKRKMESAAREMAELKRELDNAKAGKEAESAEKEFKRRNDAAINELRAALNDQNRAAQTLKPGDGKQSAEAQRTAGDRLERGGALEAVKAMQREATAAGRAAREKPQSEEKFAAAKAAQEKAAAAVKAELETREAVKKGEKTEKDLEALDARLKEELMESAAAKSRTDRAAAEKAVSEAKEAVGSEESDVVGRLAEAALAAARDAAASELSEKRLRGDDAGAAERRAAADDLEALAARTGDEASREERILALQKSAVEALERGDGNRARNLQRDILREQSRAADAVNEEEEVAARAAANAAQRKAAETLEKSLKKWNDESKATAAAAQREAMAAETAAQTEAAAIRAIDRLAAAEKSLAADPAEESEADAGASADGVKSDAAREAEAASEAMDREVASRAAALGMSRERSEAKSGEQGGKGKPGDENKRSGGGGVADEVQTLAKELTRQDSPDYFKSLFSKTGWFKIRGTSGKGLSDRELREIPREYRDLVRRYFLKLSEHLSD